MLNFDSEDDFENGFFFFFPTLSRLLRLLELSLGNEIEIGSYVWFFFFFEEKKNTYLDSEALLEIGSLGTSNSLETSSAIEASLSLLELSLDEPLWNDLTLSQLNWKKKNEKKI